MEYTEIRELSASPKCRVTLVGTADGRLAVRKEMNGEHSAYRRLRELTHPCLPKLLSVEFGKDSTVVFEEYINGASLGELHLTPRQTVRAMRELCGVLSFLHAHGIVHRDIKPSNLLLAPDGHIRLIDFDAARTVKTDADRDTRLLGTEGFAPPEQYGFSQTDARADVYAVGVTLRTLLGSAAAKRRYARVIKKCTAFDPKDRYPSAEALGRALTLMRLKTVLRGVGLVLLLLLAALVFLPSWSQVRLVFNDLRQLTGQDVLPYLSQGVTPEDRLFYYPYMDDAAVTAGQLAAGQRAVLSTDLDGDGTKEYLAVYAENGGWTLAAESGGQKSVLSRSGEALPADGRLQLSACDSDENGVKEIYFSVGSPDGQRTDIYTFADGVFRCRGEMDAGVRLSRLYGHFVAFDVAGAQVREYAFSERDGLSVFK